MRCRFVKGKPQNPPLFNLKINYESRVLVCCGGRGF